MFLLEQSVCRWQLGDRSGCQVVSENKSLAIAIGLLEVESRAKAKYAYPSNDPVL